VEEEQSAREILAKLDLLKDDPSALLDLDRDLGSRGPGAD
jgi:ferritin